MTLVFASASPLDPYLVVGSQHLSREMARKGHQLIHVGPPATLLHGITGKKDHRKRFEASLAPPIEIAEGLLSITPLSLIPWQVARCWLSPRNFFLESSNLKSIFKKLDLFGKVDVVLIDDPRFVGLGLMLQPKAIFYRATDLYADFKSDKKLIVAERLLLPRCAGVIATSLPVLHHLLTLKPGLPCLLLENGVEYSHFSNQVPEAPELKDIPHPRAIYVGALDLRFDVDAIFYLSRHFPNVHIIIIGPGEGLNKLKAWPRPNIHLLGPRPYAAVPSYLQHCEVGLLPLTAGGSNPGRSPMKLYEYGAAGLRVLATHTIELARRREPFIHLYRTYNEASSQMRAILESTPEKTKISESCRALSWENKSDQLLDFIQQCLLEAQGEQP